MAASKAPVTPRRFYHRVLTTAEQADLPAALEVGGIDDEIALLRLRLRTALEEHPEDMPLMFKGLDLLTSMVVKRYRLPKADERDLGERNEEVLREVVSLLEKAERHD